MSECEPLSSLSKLYPALKINPSKLSGVLSLKGTDLEIRVDTGKDPQTWVVFDKKSGTDLTVKDVHGPAKIELSKFTCDYREIVLPELKKDPLKNLKAGGFEITGEVTETQDEALPIESPNEVENVEPERAEEADKLAQLDAIMNGEIEPETKQITKVQKAVRSEKPFQRMPALIPPNMRDMQIQELSTEDIKHYICPNATDQEAFMFLKLCQARQLNPFLNEAYLIKYGDKATMTVGKEAFMRRAEAHPQFDGFEAGIIIQTSDKILERREGTFLLKNEVLVGGWAKIYRKDRKQCFVSEVALHEYGTGKSLWISKPATMIRKVAIVQGMREAFPAEFSGMYDTSELGINDPGIIEAQYQNIEGVESSF